MQNPGIHPFVSQQLPEFIRIEHPTIVSFLSAYYEWMDINQELYSPMGLKTVSDIDESMDKFVAQFKQQYLLNFPEELALSNNRTPMNVRQLAKNIKQFYQAKGTEKTYEFLFRILYDTAVEFYYPKRDILRLSDGKWIQKNSVKTTNTLGSRLLETPGFRVYQRNQSGSIVGSAQVSTVNILQVGSFDIAEVFLTGINGTFAFNKQLEFFDGDNTLIESSILPVISQITITSGGSNYKIGDRVVITAATGDSGRGARGIVSAISSTGAVTKIKIDDFGVNYRSAPNVTIISSRGTGFSGTCSITGVCVYDGYYANNDGRLSTNKVMQDNRIYQDYSYVIQSEMTVDKYRDIVRKLIHPAGLGFFGEVSIKRCAKSDLNHSNVLFRYNIPLIGNYAPYTFETYDDLSAWFNVNGRIAGYDPNQHDTLIIDEPGEGNPITNDVSFAEGTSLLNTPNTNGDPFWVVFQHPNRLIEGTVTARIWQEERIDFLTSDDAAPWHEWTLDPDRRGEWAGFTGDYAYTTLRYDSQSAFRKIVTDAFFKVKSGAVQEFDCRSEKIEPPSLPVLIISVKGIGIGSTSVANLVSNGSIVFTIETRNPQNLEWYAARIIRFKVERRLSSGAMRTEYYTTPLTSTALQIDGFETSFYTITAEILNPYDTVVVTSNSLTFNHFKGGVGSTIIGT